jgi:hydrogenase maturation protein HypF
VYGLAQAGAIRGRVWNHPAGVTIEAFGEVAALRAFVGQLERPPMPAARIRDLLWQSIPDEGVDSFAIVASDDGPTRCPSIPPDLATCEECWRELRDSRDRRYHYPFINCTRCGPRYTICLDVPYDRPRTTMAGFPMCEACRREYEDPDDRRFHAQPNACPICGPRVRLVDAHGIAVAGEPIATAAQLLRDGRIVAVKGLGGYHLACDATRAEVVELLRARKQRDEKPLAVMVPSLEHAEALAWLTDADREMLAGSIRPIVLVPRRPGSDLVNAVAPGNALVGLMLPYTPLHQLLLAEVGRPLIMTSGNRSDEPMVCGNDEALRRLGDIVDAFLQHDREIASRCDDSVARVVAGRPVLLRRGRGWTPGALRVAHRFPQPILACGAHLKSTFCLGHRDLVWLGPHVGDLETHEACTSFEVAVERFQRFVGIAPEVVVHDLHPDYFTTRYAKDHPAATRISVQHHHAHIASAMAEHGLDQPVIGLAWDGTGYGTDGTAWGGELLLADFADFRRLATFRPIPLAGGDRAIREVWRIALALLDDAFDGASPLRRLALFDDIDSTRIGAVRRMIGAEFRAPLARGVGRYFDAFGALVLAKAESRYEGQIAMELTFAADPDERRPYPFEINTDAMATVDLRPTVRAAVDELLAGTPASTVSGRFHATLVVAAVELVRLAERDVGQLPVVLSGGCFQNARLVEDLLTALASASRVYRSSEVPPNDGGIAVGQAMVAGARLRRGLSVGSEAAYGAM